MMKCDIRGYFGAGDENNEVLNGHLYGNEALSGHLKYERRSGIFLFINNSNDMIDGGLNKVRHPGKGYLGAGDGHLGM